MRVNSQSIMWLAQIGQRLTQRTNYKVEENVTDQKRGGPTPPHHYHHHKKLFPMHQICREMCIGGKLINLIPGRKCHQNGWKLTKNIFPSNVLKILVNFRLMVFKYIVTFDSWKKMLPKWMETDRSQKHFFLPMHLMCWEYWSISD